MKLALVERVLFRLGGDLTNGPEEVSAVVSGSPLVVRMPLLYPGALRAGEFLRALRLVKLELNT